MQEALQRAGLPLHAGAQGTDGSVRPRVIGSIAAATCTRRPTPTPWSATLADAATRIVSLTITEGGYHISDVTGEFEVDPRRGRRPRARSRSRHGVRTRRRGARPATAVRRRRLHRAVLRQRLGQRRGGPAQLHRVRRAQGPRARPVDGRARDLPQLDGRPDHAGHLRPGPPRPGRPVRGRGRVAGGRRAVRPVGAARTASSTAAPPCRTPGFSSWTTWRRTS